MLSHESKPLENTRGARIKELERPKSDEDGNFTPENDNYTELEQEFAAISRDRPA
jgi:hypothetical protein